MTQPTTFIFMENATYEFNDSCNLAFSIFGLFGILCSMLLFIHIYVNRKYISFPENTWSIHFLSLIGILLMFVVSSTYTIWFFSDLYIITILIQIPPSLCVSCLVVLAINLFLIYNYNICLSSNFLFVSVLLITLVVPIMYSSLVIQIYVSELHNHKIDQLTLYAIQHEAIKYIIGSIYVYLDYLLTISMCLTLCSYKTLYGKILCLTTWITWILWNIHWCVSEKSILPYLELLFGYILLVFYICPLILASLKRLFSVSPTQYLHMTFPPIRQII
ncbi:membrane protein EE62 [Proboscivirus elephantidbeta5]|uniref:Membrane protein EE62 n=1 Tax=Elephant endotheliotropic herpesvirus 5 TaxID=768738 RepID=A0A075CZK2_9BETA|nr:membrane protein EE62 [Elephant endotheliotropic herpesvirus 5]AHC02813.1 membrane protein EE62 [Elephant endotheliotropic herpesvirus 5]